MILKEAPLPEDIVKLGVDGVNRIWKDAKVRGAGMKRAKTLVAAAEHCIGSREASEASRVELEILLSGFERQTAREAELMEKMCLPLAVWRNVKTFQSISIFAYRKRWSVLRVILSFPHTD
jgi:hypothetical protein